MATVDSLDIQIEASAQKANTALDSLAENLEKIKKALKIDTSSLENITGKLNIGEISKQAKSISADISNMSAKATQSMKPIQEQAKIAAKSLSEIAAQYSDLGKGFTFKGSVDSIQKQIDKYSNALENAKLKKEELEAAGKTDGRMYEEAVAKTIEYTNVIESLKQQLAELQSAQLQINVNTSKLEEGKKTLADFEEELRRFDSIIKSGGVETEAGPLIPVRSLEMHLEELMSLYPQATELIAAFKEKIEEAGRLQIHAGSIDLSAFENADEKAKAFREQLKQLQVPKINEENITKLQGELEKAKEKMASLKVEMSNKLTMGKITESLDDKGYRNLREQIALTGKTIDALQAKMKSLSSTVVVPKINANIGGIEETKQKVNSFSTQLQNMGNLLQRTFTIPNAFAGLKFAFTGITKAAATAGSAILKVASTTANLVSGIKGAISKLSSMAKSIIGLKGASNSMNTSLGSGLKSITKYIFGLQALRAVFNKLQAGMKEGLGNLAQYSAETNQSMSMLKSSLGALKNSLATAFAPVLNVIAPILSSFIDMLTTVSNKIGQFFAALTGQSFAAQAKKNFTDYAAGISKAGGVAKKAGEDVQKGARAFDELKMITTNNQDDSSGGNSGEVSPADMFETVPVESNVSDFAQKLKDAWASADFTDIGAILGTKLKTALDGINWNPIKETAAKIGKSIGTLINGFVEVDGLADSIGRTIGEAINTGITGINAFLDNTHWDSVGIFIGEGLNGIVNTVDWEGLGHLFAAKWNAVFEVLGNLATTFDWSNFGLQLATSVNTFITDFDWAENGVHLGELIKGFLDTLITFLEETDWQELGNGIADFIGGIDWGGILERLAEGIGAALGGLAALLWGLIEDAWNNVIEWWQETAFEDGKFTMFGLLNGVWEGIKNIASWIYEHIFTPFINGFKTAFGIASPSKVMEEQGGFIMQGLLDGISSLVQSVIDIFNNIKENIVEIWGAVETKTSEIWSGIKIFVSGLWTELKTNVSDVFGSIKTTITTVWNSIKSVTTSVWNGIKNAVKTPVNAIIGFINKMLSGVGDGLNGMIDAVNQLHFELPDWLPLVGGKSLGFTIPKVTMPQIPQLANGAVFRGGNPFAAIVNDQPRGQTNIEAPLKVIKQALREELEKWGMDIQLASFPKIQNYQLAQPPKLDDMYQNSQKIIAKHMTQYGGQMQHNNGYGQEYSEEISLLMSQNQLLRQQNELLERILKKPTMEVSELGKSLANDSWLRGGNTGKSGMRLAVASELYG